MWAFISKGGWVLIVLAVVIAGVNRELARAKEAGKAEQLAEDAVAAKTAWDTERAAWSISTGETEARISSLSDELD